jgi:hypothetical protein
MNKLLAYQKTDFSNVIRQRFFNFFFVVCLCVF